MIDDLSLDTSQIGTAMYQLVEQLYPLCRSITGNGVRETLRIIQTYIPLTIHEVPSGTAVFDWIIPNEWNISDAYIKTIEGEKIVDFQACNLHVLNYSTPIHAYVRADELRRHIYSLPNSPTWIPYRTSYYQEQWGFCLAHEQLLSLHEEEYEVFIDSKLEPGFLTYGEYCIPGETTEEMILSCHICHPSLANDNLSGIALAVFLAQYIHSYNRRYTYRFLFIPGTIGAITWLSRNELHTPTIKYGLVLSCVGDNGPFTYKKSRQDTAEIDLIVAHVLQHTTTSFEIQSFTPYGYDERQFCSPGFNLPVGCFMRTPNGCYPEYHTSADDLTLVQPFALKESLAVCKQIIDVIENNEVLISRYPKCEPQLGRRGLYDAIGGEASAPQQRLAMLWILNLADGQYSLLDIAERAKMPFALIHKVAALLLHKGLLIHASDLLNSKT